MLSKSDRKVIAFVSLVMIDWQSPSMITFLYPYLFSSFTPNFALCNLSRPVASCSTSACKQHFSTGVSSYSSHSNPSIFAKGSITIYLYTLSWGGVQCFVLFPCVTGLCPLIFKLYLPWSSKSRWTRAQTTWWGVSLLLKVLSFLRLQMYHARAAPVYLFFMLADCQFSRSSLNSIVSSMESSSSHSHYLQRSRKVGQWNNAWLSVSAMSMHQGQLSSSSICLRFSRARTGREPVQTRHRK